MAALGVVVVVTKSRLVKACSFVFIAQSQAAVLPEQRLDLLVHSYDGGGVTVEGPSVLVRKNYKDTVSVYANYYTDMVSSASIDVVTSGSKYSEQRTEVSTGADYIYDSSILSLGVTNSTEKDYLANTLNFGLSQDFFGDLTTLTMGYMTGDDTVMVNGDEDQPIQFKRDQKHQRFSVGLSQVASKNWVATVNLESVIDAGYLNNPYRSVRYFDGEGAGTQAERYPETHNSDALALRTIYYLPYRAALQFQAKAYQDSWDIKAHTYELRYTHPIAREWIFEAKVRSYNQTQANFYSDIFARKNFQTYLGRDKELSSFSSMNYGLGVTYKINQPLFGFFDKSSINFYWDNMQFSYDNFRNTSLSKAPAGGGDAPFKVGEEPFYAFTANVLRLFFSAQY